MDQCSVGSSEGDSGAAAAGALVRVEAMDDDMDFATPDQQNFIRATATSISSSPPSSIVDSGLYSSSAPSSPTKEMSPVPVPITLSRESPPRQVGAGVTPAAPKVQHVARHKIQKFDLSSGIDSLHLHLPGDEMRDMDLKLGEMEPNSELSEDKKVFPLAFTVDFGQDTKKSLEINDSISKFAPRRIVQKEKEDNTKSLGNELQLRDESSTAKKQPIALNISANSNSAAVNGSKFAKSPQVMKKSCAKISHFQRNRPTMDICNNNHVTAKDKDDVGSETGTYTLEEPPEVSHAREKVDKAVAGGGGQEPGQEWVREWAETAAAAAAQQRISSMVKAAAKATPREGSVLSDSGCALGYASDSSNEGFKNPVKYNRAFSIRRGRAVGYDSDNYCPPRLSSQLTQSFRAGSPRPQPQQQAPHNSNALPPRASPRPPPAAAFSRTDGGRFSLRAPKAKPKLPYQQPIGVGQGSSNPAAMKKQALSQTPNPVRRDLVGSGGRSNSTLTAKEVELANWKRRKNYDPLKAAQGAKKEAPLESGSESPGGARPPLYKSALLNSSSSHHHRERGHQFHKELQDYYVSGNSEDEEIGSSHSSSSPTNLLMSRSLHGEPSQRPKPKLEALDSLVISTIHSLSIKVRTCSRQLLEKLQSHYSADENGALLEEMVTQLKDLENSGSPTRTTSRELSGTLKNLKKIEQVILVLDRVLYEEESDPV